MAKRCCDLRPAAILLGEGEGGDRLRAPGPSSAPRKQLKEGKELEKNPQALQNGGTEDCLPGSLIRTWFPTPGVATGGDQKAKEKNSSKKRGKTREQNKPNAEAEAWELQRPRGH